MSRKVIVHIDLFSKKVKVFSNRQKAHEFISDHYAHGYRAFCRDVKLGIEYVRPGSFGVNEECRVIEQALL